MNPSFIPQVSNNIPQNQAVNNQVNSKSIIINQKQSIVNNNKRNLNLSLNSTSQKNQNLTPPPNADSKSLLDDNKIKSEIDILIKKRLTQIVNNTQKSLSSKNPKSSSSKDASDKSTRNLFLDGMMGSLGGALGGVTGAVGGLTDAVGGPGVAIGAGAVAAGAMAGDQRKMEHMYAMQKVENEMAAATFSTDFQDQGILDLSRAFGRLKYVDGRLMTLQKTFGYSLDRKIDEFYEVVY